MIESILFWAAVTTYALATLFLFLHAGFRKSSFEKIGVALLPIGLIPHFSSLVLRWIEVGHGPYSTRYEVLSANAFVLVTVYLLSLLWAGKLKSLAVFVAPVTFILMGLAVSTFDVRYEVPIIFKSWWLFLHIGFAKAFGACTILAAATATGYLIRQRKPKSLSWMPDTDSLDLYAHQFLLVAFLFLGIMIIAGSLWANQSWGRYWGWDPIETSALVTWIAFGIILHFRVLHHWDGKRMAWLTLLATLFMIQTIYVVVLLVPTIHNSYLVGQ